MRSGSTVSVPFTPHPVSPTPSSTVLEARCIPQGTSSKTRFHTFIICFLYPSLSLPNKPGYSLGYPRFLLLLPVAVCPYMSRMLHDHRKRQFMQTCYCCTSHQHFGTKWGIGSHSMASVHTLSDKQYSCVQGTRKPQNKGNPRFCSA